MSAPVRRVVTGKDATGKAIALLDAPAGRVHVRQELGVSNTMIWVTDSTPADLSGAADAANQNVGVTPPSNGTIFRMIEFAPQQEIKTDFDTRLRLLRGLGLQPEGPAQDHPRDPGMHRTRTIDYIVVVSGEIDLLLDDADIHLKAGDVVVQRGTNHAWVNRGDQPCRMAVVLVDAKD